MCCYHDTSVLKIIKKKNLKNKPEFIIINVKNNIIKIKIIKFYINTVIKLTKVWSKKKRKEVICIVKCNFMCK